MKWQRQEGSDNTVHDYMRALYQRFTFMERIDAAEAEVREYHRQLAERLGKQERSMLLRLVDLEADLRDRACLNSFISGYRLACGIQNELLADRPPYCFAEDDERRACRMLDNEKRGGI